MNLEPVHKIDSKKVQYFPLSDILTASDRGKFPGRMAFGDAIVAIYTGEKRPPRKGEWFLSGGPIEAYRSHSDLTHPYHIAKLVHVREERYIRIIASATDNQPVQEEG